MCESAIPYQAQDRTVSHRTCGAAALSMAYHSLGHSVTQTEIWPIISRPNSRGVRTARSYLLTQDAIARGLDALTVRLSGDPWPVLIRCHERGVRMILNHRLTADSDQGHYTIVVDIDANSITLHDPHVGPNQHVSREHFLDLWQPRVRPSEIVGGVLVAIARPDSTPKATSTIPETIPCPRCTSQITLRPSTILEPVNPPAPDQNSLKLFCPKCDAGIRGASSLGS